MSNNRPVILVVDDEEFNLDLIEEYLDMAGMDCVRASDGEMALKLLNQDSARFSAILLDRMMPGIDGLEVLEHIQARQEWNNLPVIMQTAMSNRDAMLEGLAAGAHYYLSKPYDSDMLITIVRTAVRDYARRLELQNTIRESANTLTMMEEGRFVFSTMEEGKALASVLANACEEPDRVVIGLTELMINAVEHGNLGISYEDKSRLNVNGDWQHEIEYRMQLEENRDKHVAVDFSRKNGEIRYVIKDEGPGFDWEQYMEMSPERAFDTHGRGIALARSLSFTKIEFKGNGNEVCAVVSRGEC